MANTAKLRKLDTSKSFTPEELELINKNWWDIEQALASVGAITPGSLEFPPTDTYLKFGRSGPSFAATPLPSEDIPVHDHTKHTNRLRRVQLPVGAWETNSKSLRGTDPNALAYIDMPNGADTFSHYLFIVPADYESGGTLTLMAAEPTNDGNDFDIDIFIKKFTLSVTDVTAAYDTVDNATLTPNGANKISVVEQILSISLAPNDVLRITIKRLSTDPNATDMMFFGAYFEYLADM